MEHARVPPSKHQIKPPPSPLPRCRSLALLLLLCLLLHLPTASPLSSTPLSSALAVVSSQLATSLPPSSGPCATETYTVSKTLQVSYTAPPLPSLPTSTLFFLPGYLVSASPLFYAGFLSSLACSTNSAVVTFHSTNFGLDHAAVASEVLSVLRGAADLGPRQALLRRLYASRSDVFVPPPGAASSPVPPGYAYHVPPSSFVPVRPGVPPPPVHYLGHSLGAKLLCMCLGADPPPPPAASVTLLSPNNADLLTSQLELVTSLAQRVAPSVDLSLLKTIVATLASTTSLNFAPPPSEVYASLPSLFGGSSPLRARLSLLSLDSPADPPGLDMALDFLDALGPGEPVRVTQLDLPHLAPVAFGGGGGQQEEVAGKVRDAVRRNS